MKILGKYKDYYDYLQGVYGVDPLLTFDRRYDNMLMRRPEEEAEDTLLHKIFFVGGRRYNLYYFNKKACYTLDELNELNSILIEKKQNTNDI